MGFHHRMRESWKRRGRWYLRKWPSPRAMASIRGKIGERTDRRPARLPLETVVENLNPVLRGLGAYFRYGNSAGKFDAIDTYVNQRLAILATPSTGYEGGTAPPALTLGGSPASASIASAERSGPRLRMPDGERCR